jgi:hypothetical protein
VGKNWFSKFSLVFTPSPLKNQEKYDFLEVLPLEKSRAVKFWNLKPFSSKEKVGPPMRLG